MRVLRHNQSLVDLPTALIGALWLLLWIIWPVAPVDSRVNAQSRSPDISYVHLGGASLDDPLPLTWESSPRIDLRVEAFPMSLCVLPERETGYLQLRKTDAAGIPDRVGRERPARSELPEYRPLWNMQPAFRSSPGAESRTAIGISRALEERGFEFAGIPESMVNTIGQGWLVELYVEMDEYGMAEYVAVRDGAGRPELDNAVVRAAYRSRLSRPGKRCGGLVRIGQVTR